ncbi:MAG: tetratricopeptide (TPR) repeat protein [Cognaticolwellia sp.]|jgi:tetratricopeptide (TPR) repeat protein
MSEWSPWGLDASAISELRLSRALKALDGGDPVTAMLEAEELLDEDPDNIEAIVLVGEASLDQSSFATARIAFQHALGIDSELIKAWAGLSLACYELTDLESCASSAQEGLRLDEQDPALWYYLAVALEQLDHHERAEQAFSQASRIDGANFPRPLRYAPELWGQALKSAMELLPTTLRDWYQRFPVELHRFPDLEELRIPEPPLSPAAGALYLGEPPTLGFGNPWATQPQKVRVFTGNLERGAPLPPDMARIVATALRQEALDWLGLDDHEAPLS